MPGSTTKGVPYPFGSDAAATLDTTGQSMAEWVDARPGVAALTTVQRDDLAGATRWTGRMIYNTDTRQNETWDGTSWVGVGGASFARSFMLMGA